MLVNFGAEPTDSQAGCGTSYPVRAARSENPGGYHIRGNFELNDDSGRLLFSDDDNGRALVGQESGKLEFIFENRVESGKGLKLRNITRVPPQQVTA